MTVYHGFDITIRPTTPTEIPQAATILAEAYNQDIFFKWCVPNDKTRAKIVADYYKVYLRAKGCISHIAEIPEFSETPETPESSESPAPQKTKIIATTIWLPHDTDPSIYEEIERVVGSENAPMFREVAERSHANEPQNTPFYQLVGFGVLKEFQGKGIGCALLKHHIDILDKKGIPTYLEASTPYHGGGVYGKFNYKQFGELMFFTDTAVLYPLFRPAKKA